MQLYQARNDGDPDQLIAKSRANAAKRAKTRQTTFDGNSALSARNRTAPVSNIKDEPHVPFLDDYHLYNSRFALRPTYLDPVSEAVRSESEGRARAGGYRIEEAWERALSCAVMGLDLSPASDVLSTVQSIE